MVVQLVVDDPLPELVVEGVPELPEFPVDGVPEF